MNQEPLKTLSTLCTDVMRCDQFRFQKRIRNLKSRKDDITKPFEKLMADIEKSLKLRQRRFANLPQPQFPDDLPVSSQRENISDLIAQHQVVIVAGETGSGKTTQLPKICLSLERGVTGMIACTQPRRIAARAVASRVASELDTSLGNAVGYKVRFSDRLSADTYIKFMTDGILLAETQGDRFLDAYDTIIIDEAHERSLNIDFLLGYLKKLLPKRPDLKVIITSATIDTKRFSKHFNNAPVIEVSGRTYPVEVRYHQRDEEDDDMAQAIIEAVDEITLRDKLADILIFLAGEREIRETADALAKHHLVNTEVVALYARLSAAEQNRVFNPNHQRRIILATNVAETSLTVPRIKAVIDTGFARISRYSIRNKVQRLPIEKISRSSADQRKGRCGRIAPGLCIRLYSAEDYDLRPQFTDPEILRTSLASVILQMLALGLGDVTKFPFIDPPSSKIINDGFTLLLELGAVDEQRRLTQIGRQVAKLPIDPRIARMILAATQKTCLKEILIIASALSIQDPRERPMDAQQAADVAQEQFRHEISDFLSYLNLWDFYHEQSKHLSKNKLRHLCRKHFLSHTRMREWIDIHKQLNLLIKESGCKINQADAGYNEIHEALLTGLLGNIACKADSDYLGARQIKLNIHPSSSLFKKQPKWIMASELVETSRLYARSVAKINPEWIEPIAQHLCQTQYFEAHWQKRPAQVGAFEKVTLYGLTIIAKRKINYGPIDPKYSREIFIRGALVEAEYNTRAAFFKHNQELIADIERLEHKSRRQDILVDSEDVYAFYNKHIPEGIYNGKAFETWLAKANNPKLLFLTREDLMQHTADNITAHVFPDYIHINSMTLPLNYHFEPKHEKDGVTVTIPLALLNQLNPAFFEWLVPGLLEEKIIALLRSLPKQLRKSFVPVPDVAKDAVDELKLPTVSFREGGSYLEYPKQSLIEALTRYCHRRLGKPVEQNIWNLETLPTHLLMNFQIVENAEVAMGRDLVELQQKWGTHATENSQQQIADTSGLERDKLTKWDFGDLPEQVTLPLEGITVQGYPTLIDQETHVALRVLDNPNKAKQEFSNGLRRLFMLNLPTKKLQRQMPIDHKLCLQYMKIGKNCEQFKQDMLITIIDSLFLTEPLARTSTEFEQRLVTGKSKVMQLASEYAQHLEKVLEEYHQLTQKLNKSKHPSTTEIKQHLKHLIYDGFIKDIPLSQLKHIPRYLKAIQIRLTRLEHDPQKDARKAAEIDNLWKKYIKSPKVEVKWMLEELRVSLFAPELKTAYPVSVQRVERMFG
ncbi:ATP-dependent RNA helicase HrpA [Candidatus Marithrix sp. Canyon 246]|uniref:ATP-dependent RNA helicase HrpA n=2 Tax=Candidatus Marithrix sp. Canyon 246 TaxID=1827136 RepID=UPI000A7EF963|nr:ATP-dependent RNA helicase HrpA [Candidatus Marithrix sp. Canyon 246]